MVRIEIPYLDEKMCISVPDDRLSGVLKMNKEPLNLGGLKEAVEKPLDSSTFPDFIKGAEDVIFIVNDATRPTPTGKILDFLVSLLPSDIQKSFIVACGTHREPTEKEYRRILGEGIVDNPSNRILHNDARNRNSMVKVGETRWGDVLINRAVAQASRIVVVTSVEPHYFAGYTGGRKSFLPGVAEYNVIEKNHSKALMPEACTLRLEGNPVHEEMEEFARVAASDKTFSVMTVAGPGQGISGCASGDLFKVFKSCVAMAEKVYTAPIKEKAEVVVSVAQPPTDISLYQSQKALENGRLALKDGGVIILVSACREGIGSMDFYNVLKSNPEPHVILENIRQSFKLGSQKTAKIAELQTRANIWAFTGVEPKLLSDVRIKPVSNLQDAVECALDETGGKVFVLPEGGLTVPLHSSTTCSRLEVPNP